jgi:hypothetical protein
MDKTKIVAAVVFFAIIAGLAGGWSWWTGRQFDFPGDQWTAKALDEARGWADDAQLRVIEGRYVRPDGVAELRTADGGWHFLFYSANRASGAAASTQVPGAPAPPSMRQHCFSYSVGRGGGRQSNLVRTLGSPTTCPSGLGAGPRHLPRCSIAQVWQRAIQRGAPNPGYAWIVARADDGAWRWNFKITGHVDLEIPDDC